MAKLGENVGINGIGFGELSGGFGEVAGAFGLDDSDLDAGFFECKGDGAFKAPGGFEDDADVGGFGGEGSECFDEESVSGGRVVEVQGLVGGLNADIECGASDIDSDEERRHGRPSKEEVQEATENRPKLALANAGLKPK